MCLSWVKKGQAANPGRMAASVKGFGRRPKAAILSRNVAAGGRHFGSEDRAPCPSGPAKEHLDYPDELRDELAARYVAAALPDVHADGSGYVGRKADLDSRRDNNDGYIEKGPFPPPKSSVKAVTKNRDDLGKATVELTAMNAGPKPQIHYATTSDVLARPRSSRTSCSNLTQQCSGSSPSTLTASCRPATLRSG